ncbi:STAS domain-containing protein [Aetokthonos hydrillicola Thurmond2011]|jgi:anti-anti-sigma factor|uniref:Anti-sigma factor antagonist n=1 Tax=Aetokthonos hydrillicola Thurmond2011 TaxID=2712845 RepID=A0AAP5I891_9CYAN|nr:STAS domain-containing protein [Aetokthonos hydrillicola]MBO3463003.1 STAS domain-containing protein [Aetokthonos hydrillicola CCALA 1050]MBW4587194.1 STAS domain-containing protein [Aetokthonos hydrillicola CCALA 1050]MDR9896782.1 STAS domain-containing protein [Aetokthonos hydrillicola Thurmond2011]
MGHLVKVLQPSGSLDATKSQEFRQNITEIVETENDAKIVLVDFRDVTFMDSSGLGALVLAFKALRAADIKLVICSVNEQVRILFELTGIDQVFEIFPNQEEFHKYLILQS